MEPITCQECPARWDDSSRWRALLDDDRPIFYCPACAHREFDADACESVAAGLVASELFAASTLRERRDGSRQAAEEGATVPPNGRSSTYADVKEPQLMSHPDHGNTYQLEAAPRCIECHATWTEDDGSRWRAYLTDDEPAVVIYCACCADREFGG
jgi:hypothetical protein